MSNSNDISAEELAHDIITALDDAGCHITRNWQPVIESTLRREGVAESGEVAALLDGPKNGVLLEPDDLKFMMEQAGIGHGYDEDEACALVLWVGETIDQDGEQETRTYGLNFYNDECPEEGSICIKELPRPTHPAPAAAAPSVPAVWVPVGERLLKLDGLLADYHAAVWDAAENGGVDYDMAGVAIAKEIRSIAEGLAGTNSEDNRK